MKGKFGYCLLLYLPVTASSIASCLTATSVLLHLLVGCCAHHTHAAEAAAPARAVVAGHCSHVHEAPTHRSESPAAPGHEDDCEETECVFGLAGKNIEVGASAGLVHFETPMLTHGVEPILVASRQNPSCHDPPAPALRTHLLFQVMLN